MKINKLVKSVPVLKEDDNFDKIARLMFDSKANILPIISKEKFIGIVHIYDVLLNIDEIIPIKDRKVKSVSLINNINISEDDRIGKIIQMVHEEHIDFFPVKDKGNNIIGILDHIDLMKNYYLHHYKRDWGERPNLETRAFKAEMEDVLALPVKNFIRYKDIITVNGEDYIIDAINKMIENHVLGVVVENTAKVLTVRDILHDIAESKKQEYEDVKFVGLERLEIDEVTRQMLIKIALTSAERLHYLIKNNMVLKVHIKEYKTSENEKQHKYSVHLNLLYPGQNISTDKAFDWDIRRALHKGLKDIENSVLHKYKRNVKKLPSQRKAEQS